MRSGSYYSDFLPCNWFLSPPRGWMCTRAPQTPWNEVHRSLFDMLRYGGGMFDVNGWRISVFTNKNFKNVPIVNLFKKKKKSTEAQRPLRYTLKQVPQEFGSMWMSCSLHDGHSTLNISDQGLCILHPSVYCLLFKYVQVTNRYQVSLI